jgi:putative peptidoglycan lipid II flippase
VLYQHGKFTAEQSAQAAGALRFYAIGLSGYAALKVLVNAFYALDRRKTPMVVSAIAVGLNLLFNWLFTFHLGFGHRGLALSTGLIATVNFGLLYWLMRRQLHGLHTLRLVTLFWKVAVGCAVMVLICMAANRWLLADWRDASLLYKSSMLLLTIAVSALAFAIVGASLKIEELNELFAAIKRRLKR